MENTTQVKTPHTKWEDLKSEFKFQAQDSDGYWYAFRDEPKFDTETRVWVSTGESKKLGFKCNNLGSSETLCIRPEGSLSKTKKLLSDKQRAKIQYQAYCNAAYQRIVVINTEISNLERVIGELEGSQNTPDRLVAVQALIGGYALEKLELLNSIKQPWSQDNRL